MEYINLVNGGLAQIKPYQAGKPIEEVQRELGLKDVVKLASNENPFGVSPKALEAMQKKLEFCNFYPDSNGFYLKQKLHDKFGYNTDMITLGAGSNELINLIFQAFVNDKVNVVIPRYSFVVYPMDATICNAKIKYVDLESDYSLDLNKLYAAIDENTRMVVIANPSNPIGTAVGYKELKEFIYKVKEDTLIVIDEAYNEFCEDDNYEDSYNFIKDKPNLVVSRTFSKAYGLAGLRIGYMLANSEISSILNRLRAPFNVNDIAFSAAIAALDDDMFLDKVVKSNNEQRKVYEDFAKEHSIYMIKSQANFVTYDFKQDAAPIYEYLLKHGVIVRPLAAYNLPTMLRISIGTKEQNALFFKHLSDYLQQIK